MFLERHYIRSRNVLELKLRQSGSAACRRGALRAARKQGADDSHSTIKVWVVCVGRVWTEGCKGCKRRALRAARRQGSRRCTAS